MIHGVEAGKSELVRLEDTQATLGVAEVPLAKEPDCGTVASVKGLPLPIFHSEFQGGAPH